MYSLLDGVDMHRRNPMTFWIPSDSQKAAVKPGDYVKLAFMEGSHPTERMWVMVTKRQGDDFEGYLDNDPALLTSIKWQDIVVFNSRHIINLP
jgi:hypothetical protein